MNVHIRVDWTRCDGHGLCAALAPNRIQLDEWGFPIVRAPIADAADADVTAAASACPALALYLEQAP